MVLFSMNTVKMLIREMLSRERVLSRPPNPPTAGIGATASVRVWQPKVGFSTQTSSAVGFGARRVVPVASAERRLQVQ